MSTSPRSSRWGKLVLSETGRSVQHVIKLEGRGDYPEFGVIHGGPEDCKSAVVISKPAGGFPLEPVHTSQNQEISSTSLQFTNERLPSRFVMFTMLMFSGVKNRSKENSTLQILVIVYRVCPNQTSDSKNIMV